SQVVSHFKIEKHRVAKSIAHRKTWKKYGLSSNDKPGPNPATTITAEEVSMQFISSKDKEPNENDELKKKLMDSQKGQVKCRLCKEDHWTQQCPYKDKLEPLCTSLLGEEKEKEASAATPAQEKKSGIQGKYVPPSMRQGANKKGESMMSGKRDETSTVRVTNLSENTREEDLKELFQSFGDIVRIFLAKDKFTCASKGFAFINYKHREGAAKAISVLDGYGYDHLILNVEWAK
ncbi:UNVERIFIED_CONTAM: hypothetical protein GTU68_019587, partial [Idotea baltica]|nr:hypothetical protein [Idotea baltica]